MKQRNKFNLSHRKLTTMNMGTLVPIGCVEVIPGDTFRHHTSMLIRCSPLAAPPMHPVHARVHHFFVPMRLVWDEFEDFITGGSDGEQAPAVPTITVNTGTGWAVGSLADHLGIPTGVDDIPINAMPFRAYQKIWDNFYRDQDLQTSPTISLASGADTTTTTTLQNVCWDKDYFTLMRPTPQKGPDVTIPLGTTAPVTGVGVSAANPAEGTRNNYWETGSSAGTSVTGYITSTDAFVLKEDPNNLGKPGVYANLAGATAATINELRLAFQTQKFQENRSRYGSRLVDYLRGSFGVKSSDARLQLPEYLGGGKQTLQFSEVLQQSPDSTAGTSDADGVGNIYGHGIAAMRSNKYQYFFEEPGYVISVLSVIPEPMYMSGTPRMYSKTTKFDFVQPELVNIGQQEVYYRELNAAHTTPDAVIGYADRYDEYRRHYSSVSGAFRSSMDEWHFARSFAAGANPSLNGDFVKCVPTEEPFLDQSSDVLWVMANHQIIARRQLPKVGTPGGF